MNRIVAGERGGTDNLLARRSCRQRALAPAAAFADLQTAILAADVPASFVFDAVIVRRMPAFEADRQGLFCVQLLGFFQQVLDAVKGDCGEFRLSGHWF